MGKVRATLLLVWAGLMAVLLAVAIANRPPDHRTYPSAQGRPPQTVATTSALDEFNRRQAAAGGPTIATTALRSKGGALDDLLAQQSPGATIVPSGLLDGWTAGYTLAVVVFSLVAVIGLLLTIVWTRATERPHV